MIDGGLMGLLAVPAGLGLIGFVEPCSIGTSLVFIKYLEGKAAVAKIAETVLFAATRAVFIGLLGVGATIVGTLFLDLQRGAWVLLGALYLGLGVLVATRHAGRLMVSMGPSLRRLGGLPGSAGLGLLFGLNIPACAAPLLLALLGAAAAGDAAPADGFVALAVFGLALSLPLVVLALVPAARPLLDRFAGLTGRYPTVAGGVLIALGLWSVGFGLTVEIAPPPAS